MSVDIDEADVTVLEENLYKTSTLISTISQSLTNISRRSRQTSSRIKPILVKTNKLNVYKNNVNEGLMILSQIQQYAERAAKYESILNGSIESLGLKRYIQALKSSSALLMEMSSNVGEFKGVVVGLQTSLEKGSGKLKTFLRMLVKMESTPVDLIKGANIAFIPNNRLKEMVLVIDYFHEQEDFRVDQTYIDGRTAYVKESLESIESTTKPMPRAPKVPYEKGSNGINSYTNYLIQIISNENVQLTEIFKNLKITGSYTPTDYISMMFDKSIATYVKLVSAISSFVEKNPVSDSVLLVETLDSINRLLETCVQLKIKFPGLQEEFNSCKKLGQSLFVELLKSIDSRVSSIERIPNEIGVSEVTVEYMSRLRRFADYYEPSLLIIDGMKVGSWIPHPKPLWITTYSSVLASGINELNPRDLLSSYMSDVIDAIILSLELKAKVTLKKPTLGYFLITNLTLVEQIVNRSELHRILSTIGFERLEKLKKRALNYFLEGWKLAASNLLDVTIVTGQASSGGGKITSKEKDALKDKFKNFNESFEDLVKQHKAYNITDPNLRKFLKKEVSFIGPLYHRFYDKHGDGSFTKNASKYIKYDKKSFDAVIDSLG